jgi:hypothetical protein
VIRNQGTFSSRTIGRLGIRDIHHNSPRGGFVQRRWNLNLPFDNFFNILFDTDEMAILGSRDCSVQRRLSCSKTSHSSRSGAVGSTMTVLTGGGGSGSNDSSSGGRSVIEQSRGCLS